MDQNTFQHLKEKSWALRQAPITQRIDDLKLLSEQINLHKNQIVDALYADFKKPESETLLTEIFPLLEDIRFAIKHLPSWAKTQKVKAPYTLLTASSYVKPEPKGVCLILSPWNYPFQLAIAPLIAALAAGNVVVIKPSELSPNTSLMIQKVLAAFSPHHVRVVLGDKEVSEKLLQLPFDHIFFTGSTAVGKIVMRAASQHLSSVTLELGGKSPTIVDETADLDVAAAKIAWGKFINAGQTCVAPDYVFVHENVRIQFVNKLQKQIETFYSETPQRSRDFARIISDSHWQRLDQLLTQDRQEGSTLHFGGDREKNERYIAPTAISVQKNSVLMQEEIFGPILPLISFQNLDEVIQFIQQRPKPLALYIFSRDQINIEKITEQTSSGGLCVNETILHLANPHLPFGGIGESGSGSYHGHYGFKAFSHEKAVLVQSRLGFILKFLYPPYTDFKKSILNWLS